MELEWSLLYEFFSVQSCIVSLISLVVTVLLLIYWFSTQRGVHERFLVDREVQFTIPESCAVIEYTYFPNGFFAVFHTSLSLFSAYCRYKFIVAKLRNYFFSFYFVIHSVIVKNIPIKICKAYVLMIFTHYSPPHFFARWTFLFLFRKSSCTVPMRTSCLLHSICMCNSPQLLKISLS